MIKRYLIHYLLRRRDDEYKHIHQAKEAISEGYIESLSDAQILVNNLVNDNDKDIHTITIVGWQII